MAVQPIEESVLATHGVTLSSMMTRRHLPDCTTSGMPAPVGMPVPAGTLVSVNVPSVAVVVTATALSDAAPPHVSQVTPSVKVGRAIVGKSGT